MTYCYHCGRITAGKALFCQSCGRTYDVKLCPRLHVNPRHAEVCAQWGSRELSTPQPKVSFWWKALGLVLQFASGTFLVFLSLAVLVALLQNSLVQNGLLALVLLLIALWAAWSMVPDWFRKLVHRALKRKERRDER